MSQFLQINYEHMLKFSLIDFVDSVCIYIVKYQSFFMILSIQKCLKYTKCIVFIVCCFLMIDFIAVSTTKDVLTEIGVTQNFHYSISQTFHSCPNSEDGPTFRNCDNPIPLW